MQKFLEEISCTLLNGAKYEIEKTKTGLNVNITEGNLGFLIVNPTFDLRFIYLIIFLKI